MTTEASTASADALGAMTSWVEYGADSHFPVQNIPFGVFQRADGPQVCGTRIGDFVRGCPGVSRGVWSAPRASLPRCDVATSRACVPPFSSAQAVDLSAVIRSGMVDASQPWAVALLEKDLSTFMGMTRDVWRAARHAIQALFLKESESKWTVAYRTAAMLDVKTVTPQMPCVIGDYTDFYSSREHATNVGTMFRGKDNALQPNWLHLPVGYHGRSSTVVLSGTDVHRPNGQLQADATDPKKGSVFGPCRLMDFELEVGAFVGGPTNPMGTPVPIEGAWDRLFGLVMMNDWSARDIQKWEYVPLGPFTAKNLATSISPWIVTLDALEPFRCPTSAGAQTDPEPLPYLRDPCYSSFNLNLEVAIQSDADCPAPTTISRSNFRHMYWTPAQQLTHHSVTGCSMRAGDLLGSGTVSGDHDKAFGSMLELSWKGSKTVELEGGASRKFLKDGDLVVMTGFCQGPGFRVGMGEVSGRVLPAVDFPPTGASTVAVAAAAVGGEGAVAAASASSSSATA